MSIVTESASAESVGSGMNRGTFSHPPLRDATTRAVELHIVSDSTGETAPRLVAALEAQFPDQPFEEVRHPQVETIDDLLLAVNRARAGPR